jgi:hypothetical protein
LYEWMTALGSFSFSSSSCVLGLFVFHTNKICYI